MSTSVRDYAVLYVGNGGTKRATTGGGNVVLNAGQHALDGPEHTEKDSIASPWGFAAGGSISPVAGATPIGEIVVQVKTTTGAPTHSAKLGTPCWVGPDRTLWINGDGATTWVQIASVPFSVELASGSLSSPPTEAELEALLGPPLDGKLFLVTNTATGFRYSVTGGSGSYALVPVVLPAGEVAPAVFAMTSAPHGGWTQIQAPKAIAFGGYTYLAWHNGSTGTTEVAAWHNATRVLSTIVTAHAAFGTGADNHDAPAILVDALSHKLLIAYSEHGDVVPRMKRSVNSLDTDPTLAGGFGSEYAPAYAGNFTYMNLVQLDSGTIFWLWRYFSGSTGYLEYFKSTDGGATWTDHTQIFGSTAGHVGYWRIATDGTKIHVLTTETEPTASSTFHFYLLEDGSLHKSDGTTLGSFIHSTDCTPVLAYGAGGANWCWGIAFDGLGPAAVLMQDVGSDNRIVTARLRSGSWVVDEVVASVGGQIAGNQYATGCGIVDPNRVYYARKDGSHWEQFRADSADDGATWSETQLTAGSSVDNIWVDGVRAPETGGPEAVWLVGSYTSDTVFSFGISGASA